MPEQPEQPEQDNRATGRGQGDRDQQIQALLEIVGKVAGDQRRLEGHLNRLTKLLRERDRTPEGENEPDPNAPAPWVWYSPAAPDDPAENAEEDPRVFVVNFVAAYNTMFAGIEGGRAKPIPGCWEEHPGLAMEVASLAYSWRAANTGPAARVRDNNADATGWSPAVMQPPVTGPQKAAAADNTGVDVAVDNAGDDRAVARVRLAGRDVAVEALRAHPDRFTALFGRARSEVGHAVCLCRTDPPVRLGRCRSGRYHLANWPDGGRQHDPSCPWYRSHSAVSGRSACTEAITTTDTGTSIRLSTPLIVRGASATPTSTPARARTGTSTSRGAMGPLALLHYLWESAQLNVWHPGQGQRTWRTCHTLLGEQTSGCRVNTLDLADTL